MANLDLIQLKPTILFIIHAVFQAYTIVAQFFQITWRKFVQILHINEPNYFDIQLLRREFKKIPEHVAYSVDGDDLSANRPCDLKAIAKLVSWTWAAGVSVVSLYDSRGQIRENQTELELYLEKAIAKLGNDKRLPKVDIKFHNVPEVTKDLQGVEKLDTKNKLHIIVFSAEDGKQGIVEAVKKIIFKNEADNKSGNNNTDSLPDTEDDCSIKFEITEAKINSALDVCLEPDLLIVFGSSYSTMGFLPWHIRLTEIHWLPTFPMFNMKDFATILRNYAICDQRVGK